jgi:anti-anti-sigma factor
MGHALLDELFDGAPRDDLARCCSMPIEVNLELHGGGRFVVVVPHGEIDMSTAEELRRALLAAYWSGAASIVVDLEDVSFLDCAGLSTLVATRAMLGPGRSMIVRGARPSVRKIFDITGLVEALGVRP